jgi:hypothetical protein
MANNKNLKPIKKGELTKEEAKRRGSLGGKKSAQVKREKKLFKDIFLDLLNYDIEKFTTNEELLEKISQINPLFSQNIDVKTVISAQIIKKAVSGDLSAISMLREQIGEAPASKHELTGADGSPLVQKVYVTSEDLKKTDEHIDEVIGGNR